MATHMRTSFPGDPPMSLLDSLLGIFGRKPALPRRPRSAPRLMVSQPVRINFPETAPQAAILEDLSTGGACIRTALRLKAGYPIELAMNFGTGYRFEVKCRVVYVRPDARAYQTRYGMRFVALSDDEMNRLAAYVIEQKYGRQFGVRAFSSESEPA